MFVGLLKFLTECVQQATFPCIGGSCDDHLYSAAEPLAPPLILQVSLHLCLQITQRSVHCVCEGGDKTEEGQDMTKSLHSTSLSWPCKRNFCALKEKGMLSPVVWMKNGSQTGLFPHVTKAEIYNTMHQQYIVFLMENILNFLRVLIDSNTLIHPTRDDLR